MCIFDSKENIDVFINKVVRIASEHNISVNNSALLLLKSISLYLYYECWKEDWSVSSIGKLLNCCIGDDYSPTTFETMLSWSNINPEPLSVYKKFITSVGGSRSKEYYKAVVECRSVVAYL